jgi:hypothetical protein
MKRLLSILSALLYAAYPAWADEAPSATPYRPTVSNPAELSAPGWLEMEAGLARSKGGGAVWQSNTPWLLKLAFTDDFGVMLGGDLHVRQTDADGAVLRGHGDSTLAFKHRWAVSEDLAFGLEWGAKFATATRGLGSDKTDAGFTGIVSQDIGKYRIDANLGMTRLGLAELGLARQQYPWAAAVSRPAGENWTLALETAGVYRRGAPASSQLLAAASYGVTKRLVLDFGAATRLSEAGPQWLAFVGATYLTAKLW